MRVLNTKGQKILILFIAMSMTGLFIGFCFWLQRPRPPQEYIAPSIQMEESRLVGRKGGERQWEISKATVFQEGEQIYLSELGRIIIFQDEEPYFYLEAETAVWERKRDLLELSGPVILTGSDGFRLESEGLLWEGEKQTLTSLGPVQIYLEDLVIGASRMVFKTEEDEVLLDGGVQIEKEGLLWKAKQAVYFRQEGILQFLGNLILESKEGFSDEQK